MYIFVNLNLSQIFFEYHVFHHDGSILIKYKFFTFKYQFLFLLQTYIKIFVY